VPAEEGATFLARLPVAPGDETDEALE
jgi:hypothetical protein